MSYDPESGAFEDALADWCRTAALTAGDVVVLYYAGHGSRSPTGQYRLACADSEQGRPRSWLSLPYLAEILTTSPVRNVLFVVDACHAAAATADIGRVTDAIVATRGRADSFGAGTWLLASARHRDMADDGAFVAELVKAHEQGDGPSQRYVAPDTLAERVNRSFTAAGSRQRAACSSVDQCERPPFFTNPCFDPQAEITGGVAQGNVSDLSSHFEPRGRGVEHVHDPGSYFTGRERALRDARAHLGGEGQGRLLVVTADPGSGKSAVLGRLVLEGHADASVNAHHQTAKTLVDRLAAAADVRAATPVALFTALAGRERPFRIVVDSLDEAGPAGDKAEARRIAWELLRPLAAVACVRLVVGSRRELLPHLGGQVPLIDLDDSAYARDTDTAAYVTKILCDVGAPYEHCPGVAQRVAFEVARRAGRCFLVARMTASALLRGPVVDTAVPGWAEQLPSDVGGAFEAYLQRLPSGRYAPTMALLTALAFGEGNGLPRRIWVRVATRVSGITSVQADVDQLLDEDGSYLAHAEVEGAKYFRLYHQELTDHIKGRVLQHRDLADIQECFVEALSELVTDRDWRAAPYYVRAHLATHAAESGALDGLIEDASFVVHAVPSTLLPAVRQALRRPSVSMAVERFAYLVGDSDPSGTDRATLLAFVAHTYGEHELAGRAERISDSVERMCVEPREITPHRVVGRHTVDAYSANSIDSSWLIEDMVLPDGGRMVLAAPPDAALVHVWALDSPAESTVLPHASAVVGLGLLSGRDIGTAAVTLDSDSTLRLWDPADQTLSASLTRTGCLTLFDTGVLTDGTPVVVCGGTERVSVFSLPGLEQLAQVDCPPAGLPHQDEEAPRPSACLAHDGVGPVRLLVCDGVRGRVVLHPLRGHGTESVLLEGLSDPWLVGHADRPRGTVVVVYEEERAKVTLLDVGSMKTEVASFHGPDPGSGFAYGSVADPAFVAADGDFLLVMRPDESPRHMGISETPLAHAALVVPLLHRGKLYAVASDFMRPLEITDCATGEAIGARLSGHEGAVCAVRLIASGEAGGPDILAIGNDGTARLWRWNSREQESSRAGDDPAGSATEIWNLVPWTADPGAVLAAAQGYVRRVAPDFPRASVDCSTPSNPALKRLPGEEDSVEDPDGALNLLAREFGGAGPLQWRLVWHRLRPHGTAERVVLAWQHGLSQSTAGRFLPPTKTHPYTRLVVFDALLGRVRLRHEPRDIPQWADLPWAVAADIDVVRWTAFTTPAGNHVLLTAVRAARAREVTVGGQFVRRVRLGAESGAHPPHPAQETTVVGRLWDVGTGAAQDEGTLALAHDVVRLLPHHGATGTRWIAQRGIDGAVSVIDLETNRRHPVVSQWSPDGKGPAPRSQVPHLEWIDLPDGTPVLLSAAPDPRHETNSPASVVVWQPAAAGQPRRLPVPATGVLWAGHSPGGEALVAVSDRHGVTLCHLPSCEKVWSGPLPARVTALTAVPGSPHLDLAVGTQQGVVFLRPRLSRGWRDRLGVG